MELNDVQTKKLLEHAGTFQIKHLALRMLITRLKMAYRSNPSAPLSKSTAEINALLSKFPQMIKPDYDWIINL